MKVLSLFDGMACGAIALQAAGIEIEAYDAFEIDKYAIKVAMHNLPYIKQHGDVFKADFTRFADVDLVCGGSPCTYWSIAQRSNRETEASGLGWELFQQYVRAVNEAKPRFFIYENNYSMSEAIRESITKAFGFEPVCINSNLVSAQNRRRLYWVGQRNADGTYSKVPVALPKDRMIYLKDVVEDPNMDGIPSAVSYEVIGRKKNQTGDREMHYEARMDNKSFCLTGVEERRLVAIPVGVGFRNRREKDGKLYRRFESHNEPKANALTTVQTDSMVAVPHQGQKGQLDSCEVVNGHITIKGKQYKINLPDGCYVFRKYTVEECKRLQTVPEWYDMGVISNTRAYKCLGNGWTVDVIAHILTHLKKEG